MSPDSFRINQPWLPGLLTDVARVIDKILGIGYQVKSVRVTQSEDRTWTAVVSYKKAVQL